jgi:selenocysteine lyase/cysteine desulfurase
MPPLNSRRTFLRGAVPGAALSIGFPALLKAAATGETYWTLVRNHFSFSDDRVPMNAANLCPSPRAVAERVADLTKDIDFDCSFQNRAKFTQLLEESRSAIAQHLGAKPDEIALVRNTSEANNAINNGLALKAGDEVVVWDLNHPTNNVAWDVRAARFGIVVKRVPVPAAPTGIDELIGAFERALTAKTRVLALTHVSNVSGIRLPVRQLCEIAHRRGIYVHVDGAQTWGALHVNVHDLGCDSYSGSAHKWFLGPREVGVLYVREDRIREIWPNTVAPGWGNDAEPDVTGARKFESLGQRDDARLAAIRTTVEFHNLIGAEKVEARVLQLASALKEKIAALDLRLATPRKPDLSGGVCIVPADAQKGKEAFETLYRKFGIAAAATGGVRLCPHIYNTMDHVDRAVEGIKAVRHLFA